MTISKRTKIGFLLVIISVIAFVAFMVVDLFSVTNWHYAGGGDGNIAFVGESNVGGYYLIPILLCGLIGVICLVWPSRKPPKLNLSDSRET